MYTIKLVHQITIHDGKAIHIEGVGLGPQEFATDANMVATTNALGALMYAFSSIYLNTGFPSYVDKGDFAKVLIGMVALTYQMIATERNEPIEEVGRQIVSEIAQILEELEQKVQEDQKEQKLDIGQIIDWLNNQPKGE